ncbi:MAG: rRNA maturation RNase YbeY [Patescibacteria group bacterium]
MECVIYQTVDKIGVSLKKIKLIVFFVLEKEGVGGDLSLHFIGDRKMKTLNSLYRHKNKTTDVLSFAVGENEKFQDGAADLGDIFVDVPHIRRQATQWEEKFETEMARMIIHGILHILGYDHIHKIEAKTMFSKQENYLELIGKL